MSKLELNKIIEFLKKYENYLLFILLILSAVIIWRYYELPGITPDWAACVDYIKDGTLYNGQPKCYHGPINFFLIYYLMDFFPISYLMVYKLIVLISDLILYFLLYKIIKKLNLKPHYLLLTILFFTLIYIIPIDNDSGDSVYGSLMMLYGFYILCFSNNRYYRYILSSLFFTLAIFTKLNVLIPIGLVLIYHFKDYLIKDKKINIDYKNLIKSLTLMLLPPIIIFTILRIISPQLFPNIITYSILTQLIVEPFSLLSKLNEFTLPGIGLLALITFLLLTILISFYLFYKKRDVFSFTSLFGFILVTYGMLRGHHGYFHRYYLPILLFLIITIIDRLNNIKANYKRILFIAIILILALSSIKISDPYLTSLEFQKLKNIINNGFTFIPEPQDRILADYDDFLRYSKNINPKKVDFIIDKYNVDPVAEQRFKTLGIISTNLTNSQNLKIVTVRQYNEILDISKKINDGYYSMIIIGQLFQGSMIIKLLGIPLLDYERHQLTFNEDLPDIPHKVSDLNFCVIDFLRLKRPCPNCRLSDRIFFLDITNKEECNNLSTKLIQYYYDNFEEICDLDNGMAYTLKEHISAINKECKSKKYILKKLYEGKIATFKEALLILFFILSVILYYSLQIKKNN